MSTLPLVLAVLLTSGEAATPSGSATVPLQDLIPLYTQRQEQAPVARPPAEALVVKSELKGRLTSDALVVDAHFEVEVLASDRWTQVRLLKLDADTYLTELPTVTRGTVGSLDGYLSLVTRESGRYSFDVSFTVRPPGTGPERTAQLTFGPHVTPVPLRLEADADAFTLLEPRTAESGALDVYPRQGGLRVGWRTAVAPKVATLRVRPPLEPTIPEARASWVSTLEGRATVRVRYALRLDREQELELELPEGHRLERVLLNASPVAATAADGKLKLKVAPERFGETDAALEVVLVRELGIFHLSGQLELALPRVSWPVARLHAQAHFPAVFTYRREGGSMEAYEGGEGAGLESQMPLPGKVLYFRQYLVAASAPTLELGYSVDISDSYFR
jgi:hypothetical protein